MYRGSLSWERPKGVIPRAKCMKKGRAFTLPQGHGVLFLLKIPSPCNSRYVLKMSFAICTLFTTAPKSMSLMLGIIWSNEGLPVPFLLIVFIHSWWYLSNAAGSLFSWRLEMLFCLSHCMNSGARRSWLAIDCCFLKDVPPFPSKFKGAEGTWLLQKQRYWIPYVIRTTFACTLAYRWRADPSFLTWLHPLQCRPLQRKQPQTLLLETPWLLPPPFSRNDSLVHGWFDSRLP